MSSHASKKYHQDKKNPRQNHSLFYFPSSPHLTQCHHMPPKNVITPPKNDGPSNNHPLFIFAPLPLQHSPNICHHITLQNPKQKKLPVKSSTSPSLFTYPNVIIPCIPQKLKRRKNLCKNTNHFISSFPLFLFSCYNTLPPSYYK